MSIWTKKIHLSDWLLLLVWPLVRLHLPELRHFGTKSEQLQAIRTARNNALKSKLDSMPLMTTFIKRLVLASLLVFIVWRVLRFTPLNDNFASFVILPVLAWIGALYVGAIFAEIRGLRRALRQRLVQMGIPICIPCGYDLQGLASTRCPECGTYFQPELFRKSES